MSTSDKLQMLFEAALKEPEEAAPPRMVDFPLNPNGSRSSTDDGIAATGDNEAFDPRSEMIARVNRLNELLADG